MNLINNLILEVLKPLNVPVSFQKYSGRAKEYITFHEYFETGESYEDDFETLTSHYIQVDVWSKGDYTQLVNEVRKILLLNGFKRLNEIDLYEEENEIYHKGLKFSYLEERECL